jgi:hypothetical protein
MTDPGGMRFGLAGQRFNPILAQSIFGGTCFRWQKNCETYDKKIVRGAKKVVKTVTGRSREDVVDVGQTYVEVLSDYAAETYPKAGYVGKLSAASDIFENCMSDEKSSPRCVKDLTLAALEIFPTTSVGMIVGGPANVALYNLIIGLTEFVTGNLNSAAVGTSGSCSSEVTKVGSGGGLVETVTCADGRFARKVDGNAWSVVGKVG